MVREDSDTVSLQTDLSGKLLVLDPGLYSSRNGCTSEWSLLSVHQVAEALYNGVSEEQVVEHIPELQQMMGETLTRRYTVPSLRLELQCLIWYHNHTHTHTHTG